MADIYEHMEHLPEEKGISAFVFPALFVAAYTYTAISYADITEEL